MPNHETWVAADPASDGRVVALMALSDTMVEQLYVAPDWIGRGLGGRLLAFAKERRPDGLDLFCFQVNAFARRFYERRGLRAGRLLGRLAQHGAPARRAVPLAARRARMTPPPSRTVVSADGTPIAVFTSGSGPAVVLVHGTAGDHTTFRVVGPRLAERRTVHAIDRRGRGASGDTLPYAIEREFEDVAAVAEAVAAAASADAVDVVGHSYGGRCALGAALRTGAIRRVVSYEGAPSPPGSRYGDTGLAAELTELDRAGHHEALLEAFMRRVVGMDEAALAAYRADPVWPLRVAAAHTIPRELRWEDEAAAAGLEALGDIRQPVLQILGGDSLPAFADATTALDARLADGRVVVIPGARHAAHHTHPDAFVEAVTAFLAEP